MKQVNRFDYADLKTAVKTDEGFLRDTPIVGRVGIQQYRKPDGTIYRELRLPEEVFNADALASFVGKPITVDHPTNGKVTATDAHRVTIGAMLAEGRQDGDFVRADIVLHSPDAIGERRELSLGYSCKLDETPGEWQGQQYDAIQREIRVNHLSVVKSARAGSVARLNLDSNEEFEVSTPQPLTENVTMTVKIKLDNGIEYDVAPEVQAALHKLRNDASDAATKASATIDTLTATRDTLQARVDGFNAELQAAKAAGRAEAAARASLEATAGAFKVDCKDKTDRQVKEAVVAAVRGDSVDFAGKSDVYVDAAFDLAVSMKNDAAMAAQRAAANGGAVKTDANEMTSQQRYAAHMANLSKGE